jgi:hypothetical protein
MKRENCEAEQVEDECERGIPAFLLFPLTDVGRKKQSKAELAHFQVEEAVGW